MKAVNKYPNVEENKLTMDVVHHKYSEEIALRLRRQHTMHVVHQRFKTINNYICLAFNKNSQQIALR